MIEQQSEQRKVSDERIIKFIDQETALLRDLIETEARERQASGLEIEQSLEADVLEIRGKIEEADEQHHEKMSRINANFKGRCEKLK